MIGKTVFILPCDTEVTLQGLLKVTQGEEVLIESDDFGLEPLKCESITHHLIKDKEVHRYVQRVFLK